MKQRKWIVWAVALALLASGSALQAESRKKHKIQRSSAALGLKSTHHRHNLSRDAASGRYKTSLSPSKYRLNNEVLTQHKLQMSEEASKRIRIALPADTASEDELALHEDVAYDQSVDAGLKVGGDSLQLASSKVLVVHQNTGEVVYAKNVTQPTPIASVTKLMTAMVVMDAYLPLDEVLTISDEDVDRLKGTSSRLRVGTQLSRGELLQLALMASENRAAHALGRNYPGGIYAFIQAMNVKARMLGMASSRFVDPTGLNSDNVSTAFDLSKMVRAAYQYPQIRQVSTTASQQYFFEGYRSPLQFVNTNALVRNPESDWDIGLSKTGYISEAGRCLVMQAQIAGEPMILVLLDSVGKLSRIADAKRMRKWIESRHPERRTG